MILGALSGFSLLMAVVASVVGDLRKAILALWLCGLGVGGVFLEQGAELLAVVQWLLSTLSAIAFVFYAMLLGEFGGPLRAETGSHSSLRSALRVGVPVVIGGAFVAAMGLGSSGVNDSDFKKAAGQLFGPEPLASLERGPLLDGSLSDLGRVLAGGDFLTVEALGLMLFLALVGAAVVARQDRPTGSNAAAAAGDVPDSAQGAGGSS
jgi:NADH:ubiquinone oxidoreductase subunit 6 (subunit J)